MPGGCSPDEKDVEATFDRHVLTGLGSFGSDCLSCPKATVDLSWSQAPMGRDEASAAAKAWHDGACRSDLVAMCVIIICQVPDPVFSRLSMTGKLSREGV